uniref:Nudix hydrolase domain-containing protein n=1 Tax=Romanomermis culicivorax TaxID=13658 RepID=A0A915J4X4_ROMCU
MFYRTKKKYFAGVGVWQTAFRTTKPKSAPVNGVTVIPILKDSTSGRIWFVLEKQFRIPVMSFTLEFPAGLVDPNESIEQSAMRELK